jgi:hypothetical protein
MVISVRKLEDMIEGWLKPIPHLPSTWRKWIAENIWWITAIGVVISAIAIFTLLSTMFAATTIFTVNYNVWNGYSPFEHNGWWMFSSVISLLFMAIVTIITASAIKPLKNMKNKGWDLLFLVFIVKIVAEIVNLLISLNIFLFLSSLIGVAIGVVIGAYLLFEIRSYFNHVVATHKS